jgi:hypothetical protein
MKETKILRRYYEGEDITMILRRRRREQEKERTEMKKKEHIKNIWRNHMKIDLLRSWRRLKKKNGRRKME